MKTTQILLGFYLLVGSTFYGQEVKKEYRIHTIAFYNLENLYDTIDDVDTKDELSPMLKMKTGKSKAYASKIEHVAKVISEIGKEVTHSRPSIIGLAEVENSTVMQDLIDSKFLRDESYDYVHVDSKDWRGMDVALLYKKSAFTPVEFKPFELFAFNENGYRIKTRDQLLVAGYLEEELIHVIINHWPSRLSGKQKTAHLREASAHLNLEIMEEIQRDNRKAKIIIMGDFNDDPVDGSMKEILRTLDSKENLEDGVLFNPFEKLFKKGIGSLGYQNQLHLFDQIIISANWVAKYLDYSNFSYYKAGVYNPGYLTNKKGKFKGFPYRSWSNNNEFTGGYSDHYPVYMYVIKEK